MKLRKPQMFVRKKLNLRSSQSDSNKKHPSIPNPGESSTVRRGIDMKLANGNLIADKKLIPLDPRECIRDNKSPHCSGDRWRVTTLLAQVTISDSPRQRCLNCRPTE
ncbi:unnamed protein product [Leptosia nina]|uniref:Uncharacterized protein n=1 Tax=Leptosia nina TaxID=320188 RepID=A0AAV1J2Q7_9NEOP